MRTRHERARPTTASREGAPVEIGLGADEEEQVAARLVRTLPHHRARPGELGRDAVDDARDRPPRPLVEEVLAVEGDEGLGVPALQQRGDGRRRAESGVDPALERHDQERVPENRLAMDLEDLGHAAGAIGAHGTRSRDSAAISKSQRIWAGKPSTLPWSPAPAPAT